MRLLYSIAAIAIILGTALPVFAEDKNKKEAKVEFEKGVKNFNAERYEEAAIAFREANRLAPSWKLFYNIGQCEAALKNYGMALEAFERYLAEGGDEIAVERQTSVREELDRLRDMVGTVEIKGSDGDEVVVNNRERGTLPKAARFKVAMGDVKIAIRRDGAQVMEKEFKISAGELVSLDEANGEIKTESVAASAAEAEAEPGIGGHLVHIITAPPQRKVALDGRGGWHRAPCVFPAAPGAHLLDVRGGVGYRNKEISIVVEDTDLTVDVEMDRPVFQAGIIMTAAGGLFTIIGGIWAATFLPDRMDLEDPYFVDAASLTGLGLVSLVGGVFMMILDKQRDTIVNITPGAPTSE
jgi:hypothetical protein